MWICPRAEETKFKGSEAVGLGEEQGPGSLEQSVWGPRAVNGEVGETRAWAMQGLRGHSRVWI